MGQGFAGRAWLSQTLPRAGGFLGGLRPPKPSCGRAMFTLGPIRGAHNARMKIVLFLGGLRPPKPSRGRAMFTLDGHAHGAHRRDENGASSGGPPPPWPSPAGGGNRAPPRREGVGETRFPRMFTSDGHAAAPHNAGMKIIIPGRASPSQTLPRAGSVHFRVRHTLRIRLFVSHSLAHFPSASQEAHSRAGETR